MIDPDMGDGVASDDGVIATAPSAIITGSGTFLIEWNYDCHFCVE